MRENWLSILLLAFGLTAATLFAVGGVAWAAVAALGAGGAFVLGAVLGPTDPVSATSVIGSTSAPRSSATILEAESLVNDGIGLVAFSIALTAVERGTYLGRRRRARSSCSSRSAASPSGSSSRFVVERVRRRIHDARIEIPISLLTPYVAYIPAEQLHLSGILAAVACGVYLGWRSEGIFRPQVRLQSVAFWDVFTFVLSSVLFVLLGTQFRVVVQRARRILGVDARARRGCSSSPSSSPCGSSGCSPCRTSSPVFGRSRGWAEVDPWHDRFILGW